MPPLQSSSSDEERPLLQPDNSSLRSNDDSSSSKRQITLGDADPENPRAWTERAKLTNVGIIALMAILSPLASSMFTPGISQIAEDLNASEQEVIATTTGFVIMLGLGPLVLAPFSETFGRRKVYIFCFSMFTLLQIPTALSPNVATLIAVRAISGLFGSVGIANGGGTISDMYPPSQRAGVFGWYLLGPLLGPTLGPLFGGIVVTRLGWRWVYWVLLIVCAINTGIGVIFLRETYAPVLLARRKKAMTTKYYSHANRQTNGSSNGNSETDPLLDGAHGETTPSKDPGFWYEGEDLRPLHTKLLASLKRPVAIFLQPIVFTMSLYQAIIFGTTYSIYTNMQSIFSAPPYNFNSEQVGLLYLGPGLGFLTSVWFIVPRIDTVYNALANRNNNGVAIPEYRLPLANIGSVLIPASLFAFAWTVEARLHFMIPIAISFFYGIGQVVILNTVQNYYIDSFEKYAASAIAGGSVFRSLMGGVVPLFAPVMFERLGYGWGISVFGFLAVLVAPSPLVFWYYGPALRERFSLKV
jgi:multidrug resistance protein